MISVAAFKTVRARLLALMGFVAIPIAVLGVVLAYTTYSSVIRGIETAQLQTTSNFVTRIQLWFRGSIGTLVAAVASMESVNASSGQCHTIARDMLAGTIGYRAVRIRLPSGAQCTAAQGNGIGAAAMESIAESQRSKPFARARDAGSVETRYDVARIDGALYLVVLARSAAGSGGVWDAALVIEPALLDEAFETGAFDGYSTIAFMHRTNEVIVARGANETERAWLPQQEHVPGGVSLREAIALDGNWETYASELVVGPDLYVLARFDNRTSAAAWNQFLVLCLTSLLTLGLLFLTYAEAIQTNVVRWISGIETAARSRTSDLGTTVLVPIDPSMPNDIRSVSLAFNAMVENATRRETALQLTLDQNRFLMRELHHRLKNSLQVIQSYLALSRRQHAGPAKTYIAETEAKVQVLSTAYRLALGEGGMRPVMIKAFAEEILGRLSSMRQPDQWVSVSIQSDSSLVVDRIIPLGLSLVEAVIAALAAEGARTITVALGALDDGAIELRVATDGTLSSQLPSPKIVAGLATQLGASFASVAPGDILRWRFRP